MHKKRLKLLFVIQVAIVMLTLTACWDKVEIDQRSFVLALGIDHVPLEERAKSEEEHQEMAEILKRDEHYLVTYVFPKQMMGVGETTVENILLSSRGDNLYSVERQMQTRTDSQLFVGHLKSVVLGEGVLKNPKMFREVLDALEKDPLISRKVSFAVAEGEAKKALEVQPKLEPMAGQFINDLFEGRDRSSRAPLGDLDDIFISLHNNGNAVIPRMVSSKDELKVAGAAVVKDYEFVGWLGEAETIGLQVVRNEAGLFTIIIPSDDVKLPFQITEIESKLGFEETDNGYKMKVEIEAEGDIMQSFFRAEEDVLDPVFLEKLQGNIDERLEAATLYTIEKLQKEYEVDVLNFGEHIMKHHHKIWNKIENDWEEIFPTIEVEVVAEAKIRRVGLSR